MSNNEVFKNPQNFQYLDVTMGALSVLAATTLPNFSATSVITSIELLVSTGAGAGNAQFALVPPTLAAAGVSTYQIKGAGSVATDLSTYRIYYVN